MTRNTCHELKPSIVKSLNQPEGMAFEEAAEIAAVDVELLRGRV